MNKKLFFKICSVSVGSFLVVWTLAFAVFIVKNRVPREEPTEQYEAKSTQSTVKSAKIAHYSVREENGRVAVYEIYSNGYEKLIGAPDIDLTQLSPQDKSDFSKGIILKTKEELASLIEDFSS